MRGFSTSYTHIFDSIEKKKSEREVEEPNSAQSKHLVKRSLTKLPSMEQDKSQLRKALSELKKMQSDSSTNLPTNDSEYTLSNILGQGRFGIVRLAYQGGNKSKPCVLKLYNKVKLIQANALETVQVWFLLLERSKNLEEHSPQKRCQTD